MTRPWTPPEIKTSQIKPLQRLKVENGTLIDAPKWNLANEYHSRRQNIHYQSLNQGGIVTGLGVNLKQDGNDFYFEFQPGIAIDASGNCISLKKTRKKGIDNNVQATIKNNQLAGKATVIYFIIRHTESGYESHPETITEDCQIDIETENERRAREDDPGIELCRIKVTAILNISIAQDVFNPQDNELDFRYRPQAKWRSHSLIRIAIYQDLGRWQEVFSDDITTSNFSSNFSSLLQSLNHLYPSLQPLEKADQTPVKSLSDYDIITVTDQQFNNFDSEQIKFINNYLATGSVIFIEHTENTANLQKLIQTKQEMQQNLAELENIDVYQENCENLKNQLKLINSTIETSLRKIANTYDGKLNTQLEPLEYLINHPLRTTPFLFNQLPCINKQGISILTDGGVIVVIGNLSSAWGINQNTYLSRDTIRNAQEMGINILHFASQRKQLTQLSKQ